MRVQRKRSCAQNRAFESTHWSMSVHTGAQSHATCPGNDLTWEFRRAKPRGDRWSPAALGDGPSLECGPPPSVCRGNKGDAAGEAAGGRETGKDFRLHAACSDFLRIHASTYYVKSTTRKTLKPIISAAWTLYFSHTFTCVDTNSNNRYSPAGERRAGSGGSVLAFADP